MTLSLLDLVFFFFTVPATPEIYTLSLHDALPISAVVAKRVNNVTLQFADGQYRASGSGKAGSYVDASAARLPVAVLERLTRKRKAGDADAPLAPLAEPAIRAQVARSTFALLLGFQCTAAQLQYNATR